MRVVSSVGNIEYNPKFKGVNIVQIPPNAFSSSNVLACHKEFIKAINTAPSDNIKGFWNTIIGLFSTKTYKSVMLESFSNYYSRRVMQEQKLEYSLGWLRQNTGLPIKDALDAKFLSFYVFTGEHIQCLMTAVKKPFKNIMKNSKEGVAKYPTEPKLAKMYPQVKMGCESDKLLEEALKGVPIKTFRVDSLDELKNIAHKLDV